MKYVKMCTFGDDATFRINIVEFVCQFRTYEELVCIDN